MSRQGEIKQLLLKLSFPTTKLAAAVMWRVEPEIAYNRLFSAHKKGWLMRVGGFYSPSHAMLEYWEGYYGV